MRISCLPLVMTLAATLSRVATPFSPATPSAMASPSLQPLATSRLPSRLPPVPQLPLSTPSSRSSSVIMHGCSEFMDDDFEEIDTTLTNAQAAMFDMKSAYLPIKFQNDLSKSIQTNLFSQIALNPSFQTCLDDVINQFTPDDPNTRQMINEKYPHFKQYHFSNLPIAVYAKGTFKPCNGAPKPGETIVYGRDLTDCIAKCLSQSMPGRTWEASNPVIYYIPGKATTFKAHVDALPMHATYNPKLPTTPFVNQACYDAAGVTDKKGFMAFMTEHRDAATDIIRDKGTFVDPGKMTVFPGARFPGGDGFGSPHAGPHPSDQMRKFLGFTLNPID